MQVNDGRVVSNFIVQALKGDDITIYGDGSQTRSFCYVDDLIEGLLKLFFTERVYEPVNLGNPAPITMLQLAKEVIELTNSKSELIFEDLPGDDPRDREPDISKSKLLLDWSPLVSRKSGLEKTIEDLREQILIA
jgi:UDP-glucuronate decarboxylase